MELNASDTRSKSSLKEVVAESLNNTSIKDFCSGRSVVCSSLVTEGQRQEFNLLTTWRGPALKRRA